MADRLADVEGIGQAHAATLATQGLTTTAELLERGATPAGRVALSEATGISPSLILEWVNHADLFRINGVAGQYADLLEEAGVDTVVELATRNPDNLAARLAEVNAAKNLTNRVPPAAEVANWIAEAKRLPRAVFYDDVPATAPTEAEAAPAAISSPSGMVGQATAPVAPSMSTPAPPPPAPSQEGRGWVARLMDRIRGR